MITIISDIERNHPHYKLINWFSAASIFSCECDICKFPAFWLILDTLTKSGICTSKAEDQATGHWRILRPYSKPLCNPTLPFLSPLTPLPLIILPWFLYWSSVYLWFYYIYVFYYQQLQFFSRNRQLWQSLLTAPNIHSPLLPLTIESLSLG